MTKQTLSIKQAVLVLFLIFLITASAFVIGWNYGYTGNTIGIFTQSSKATPDIQRAYRLILDYYDGTVDEEKLSEHTLKQLVAGLNDRYSYYISQKDYKELKKTDSGEFVGIGILYRVTDKKIIISDVYPGSPAEESGLASGVQILAINGKATESFTNEIQIVNALRGKEGETITLTIQKGTNQSADTVVKRSRFKLVYSNYKKIEKKRAYLKIYSFGKPLQEEFPALISRIQKDTVEELIIDLRNNQGGFGSVGEYVANQFIKGGILMREKIKYQNKEEIYKAAGTAPLEKLKLVVLVNGETASQAEAFAAALQENKRAIIVGTNTFGKGTQTEIFELADGSAMQLTTGKWFTPSGKWIGEKGLDPDVKFDADTLTEEELWVKAREFFNK